MGRKKPYLVFSIFLGTTMLALISSSQGVLLSQIIQAYTLRSGQKGSLNAIYNIGCLAACISAIFINGRIARGSLFTLGLLMTGVLVLQMGLIPPYWALILLMFLTGVALGFVDQLASSMVVDLFEGRMKSVVLCILHSVFGFASLLTPIALQAMFDRGIPWNKVYLYIGAFGILVFANFYAVSAKNSPFSARSAVLSRPSLSDFKGFALEKNRLLSLFSVMLYAFSIAVLTSWFCRFCELQYDSASLGTTLMAVYWISLTISRLATGFFSIHPVTLIKVTGFTSAAFFALLAIAPSPILLGICVCLIALLGGATVPMMLSHFSTQSRDNTFLSTTVAFIFLYVGQSAAPLLMGVLETGLGVQSCMVAGAVTALLQGILMLFVKTNQQ